jgi:hypothetical protein
MQKLPIEESSANTTRAPQPPLLKNASCRIMKYSSLDKNNTRDKITSTKKETCETPMQGLFY